MKKIITLIVATLFLAGCGKSMGEALKNNLIYASGSDTGLVVESSPQTGGAKIVFGRSFGNFVSAPLVSEIGNSGDGGLISGTECIQGVGNDGQAVEICDEDAVSTLSFFAAKGGKENVCVGEMASTGLAARKVAAILDKICGSGTD